ncbi:hypothetical protein V5P93_004598 [Actinokineospora auranticolor]|uniref:Uncharacterized protein n=1 Tax=Actinokineospora auranticolor TaxID=155976 RepID=A0A2S6GSZ1_9PSEU|nr:hypothetical protein [Actinokineospora auranticolor]PPK68297.1 hypothetical protein CLV40_10520 [Actinokineospora auranticolor]
MGTDTQAPDPAVVPVEACAAVGTTATIGVGLPFKEGEAKKGTTELGSTCVVSKKGAEIASVLTAGPDQGLARVPAPDGAEVEELRLGVLPARQEIVGKTCAIATEIAPGRTLRVRFSRDSVKGDECLGARLVTSEAIVALF